MEDTWKVDDQKEGILYSMDTEHGYRAGYTFQQTQARQTLNMVMDKLH